MSSDAKGERSFHAKGVKSLSDTGNRIRGDGRIIGGEGKLKKTTTTGATSLHTGATFEQANIGAGSNPDFNKGAGNL